MSGEVPEGWTKRSLGELSSFQNGAAFKPEDWSQDGKPIIRIQNLNGGSEFNYFAGELDRKFLVQDGDLLFCWSGSRGTSFGPRYWRGVEGWLNQHIFNCQPSSLVSKEYLFFLLDQLTTEIEAQAHGGAGLVHIKKSELTKFEYGLPPLPEQQRIAEILSSVDESIRATEAVIAQAERVKRGLMEDLLTGGLGSAAIANGEVPEGWDRNILKELFVVKSSKRVFERQWRKEGIPFYRGREITALSENGRVDNDLFIDAELYEEFSRTNGVPKENDILITAIGTIGNTYLVDGSHKFYFKDASVLWLSSLNKVESKFINYWLKSDLFSSQRDIGNGTTVDSLTIGQLGGLQISFPPREDQLRIIEILSSVDDQITTNRATVEQLQRLKRGLMDDLLTGKVRTVA